jgi:predicted phosphoribosyltransferase
MVDEVAALIMATMPTASSRQRYADRYDAGRCLARELEPLVGQSDVIVLGLARGGVPVAAEVARALGAPLDLFVVRKLGVPAQPELAFGAIASGGIRVLDHELIDTLKISWSTIDSVTRDQSRELAQLERAFREGRRPFSLTHHIVILVDDGLATGSTMRAAVQAVRELKPARIIVAVPVGSLSARDDLCAVADQVICPLSPASFRAVGEFYDDFSPTTDSEVRGLLGLDVEGHSATAKAG